MEPSAEPGGRKAQEDYRMSKRARASAREAAAEVRYVIENIRYRPEVGSP